VISHKKASIKEIEKAWHGDCCMIINNILLNESIKECALLLTCNRVEVYVVGKNTEEFLLKLAKEMGVSERIIEIYRDDDCLYHLLRVASGLESMIVGENQILGQVREFYNISKNCGGIGEILDVVFRKAIHVGAKVRNLTNISKGSVSIASATIELIRRVDGLENKKVLVVGAGEMGSLVAEALAGKAEIYIANRTFERAKRLADAVNGRAVRFEELENYIAECDVVISTTSAPYRIITKDMVERAMDIRRKPILIVDIALPRDVEESVKEVEGVRLFTIDDLRVISEENMKKRLGEIKKAERIIKEELEHLKGMLKELSAREVVGGMYRRAEEIKKAEIEELFNKLRSRYGIDEDVIPILEDFVNSFIKKYLHVPTQRIKELARNGNSDVLKVLECIFCE
jgi:glutamyl-tRNA reductase